MSRLGSLTGLLSAWAVLTLGCQTPARLPSPTEPQHAIRYYEAVLKDHPERYPARVLLASALLQQARAQHDVQALQRARQLALDSLNQMPSLEAYLALARIENTAHQFTNALHWARLAADASVMSQPTDEIKALLLEAHLGLGQTNEAAALLPPPGTDLSLFGAAATAVWHQHNEALGEAARAFAQTADLARKAGSDVTESWAIVNAAGCYLDAGRPDQASPLLDQARRRNPENPVLDLHLAEYEKAKGFLSKAYHRYAALAARTHDPYVEAEAWRAAEQLGNTVAAKGHYAAAEEGFRAALNAGEIYTLGPLALLYIDADLHRDTALKLATMNWAFVKDAKARRILAQAQGGARGRSLQQAK